jgi:hypothetical protein
MTYRRDWSTVAEIDFTQQPNQTLAPDGNYTIGGFSWVKKNSINELVSCSIINGSGLNFQPASTANYDGNAHGLPYIWLSFTNLFKNYGNKFGWNTSIRLFVSIGTDNPTTNFDNELFGFDNNGAALEGVMNRGFLSSGTGSASQVTIVPSTTTGNFQIDNFTLGSSNKTMCLEISSPQLHKVSAYRTGSIAINTPFPPLSTFQPAQVTYMGGVEATTFVNLGAIIGAGTGITSFFPQLMGIILGAKKPSDSTNAYSIFYQRMRVDACFGGYDDIS